MISKLSNLFKKSDLDEKAAFRSRVIGILKEIYPKYDFQPGEDVEIIVFGETKLGLTNLHAKFLLTSQTNFELKELMLEHFSMLEQTLEMVEKLENETWEDVKKLVLPQIMPLEYAQKFSALSFPFGDEVIIGIVVDDEKSYRYATREDAEKWNVPEDEFYQSAIENLKERSSNLEMTFVPPPNGLAVVNTMDSFDAARILLPNLRRFFAENLGSPFYFGVPNRDFLICWSKQGDEDFQNSIRRQIASDFGERPYPLSKFAFEVDETSSIRQLTETERGENPDWISNN
jgi:hypothetical protein